MSFPPFTFRNNIFWHTNKWLNMFGNTKMSNHSLASNHSYIYSPMQRCEPGWQELCEGTKGLRRKVWTRAKISSPNLRTFLEKLCARTRFFLGLKQCCLGKKCTITGYILRIVMDKKLQNCKNNALVAKISNTRLTKIFWPFLSERLPTSATLV